MKRANQLLMALAVWLMAAGTAMAAEQIVVATQHTSIVFTVGDNHRLYQSYMGPRLGGEADWRSLPLGKEAYLTNGMEDYFEPALHITHADGNASSLLTYRSHKTERHEGSTETVITLADDVYGDVVRLHYEAYEQQDVFKAWTEIVNGSKGTERLEKYASSLLHLRDRHYYLTQYDGNWASEVHPHTQELFFGKKVMDTKLGARENLFTPPFFQLALGREATETEGRVLVGTLAWTGNFRFTFEVDEQGGLRVISGINPYASQYALGKGQTFTTPQFVFTLSDSGTGTASRRLHDWARLYQIKDGTGDRMTLLNNWEATYFDFDEQKLVSLIGDAKRLGVDMFLLDDGWFGNKYKRHSDTQALGDWEVTADKLPNGIGRLTDEAKKQGIKFGLWIEPEMVSPKSELYEKHRDWVIRYSNRDEYYFRNQLVLDMSNPKVQDYVFGVVDGLMTKYPDIAYFKWDCNSPITNIYSAHEKLAQTHLYVDYVRGLYNVLDRIKAKYPDLPMMLCSGGGGRADYGGLKYFTEMWPSDNTDPVERLYMQWSYSLVFPAKVQCAHITTWNKVASLKFKINVAMMGKMGFDINLHEIGDGDMTYCQQSVALYKNVIKPLVLDGDQYRLVSPYEGNHTSTMFVAKDRRDAVVFAFDVHPRYGESLYNVVMQGLDPDATYSVQEINRTDGRDGDAKLYTGRYLMTEGLPLFTTGSLDSRVYRVKAQ